VADATRHPLPRSSKGGLAIVARWLAAALLSATVAPAWALDLPGLAALLGQRRNAEARFVEERFVAGLDQPLRSSGTLSFRAPDRFARTTLEPRPESMSVDGNTVTLKRGGRTRQMNLDAVPEATALVEALRGTLSGDLATLQKFYTARVDGNATRWKLTLTPLAQRLGTQVRQLDIEGQGPDLKSVEVQLAGGDRSVMSIDTLR
jgi:outer membrane lipoprotein-sorting protein